MRKTGETPAYAPLVAAAGLASTAFGLEAAPVSGTPNDPVIVVRGTVESAEGPAPNDKGVTRRESASASRIEHGVIVMRPAPDSFLLETRRLAAEAAARDARQARRESELVTEMLLEALRQRPAAPAHETYIYTYWPGLWPIWRPQPGFPPVEPIRPPAPKHD